MPPQAQPVTLNLSSIVAAGQNVLLTRVTVDRPAVLSLTLGAQNSMDLPIAPGHTAAALTLKREANAWIDNAAVLLECDSGTSPSYALRGVAVDAVTTRIRFVNGTDQQHVCPVVTPHPIYGPSTLGSAPCSAAGGGGDDWRFDSVEGTIRLQPQPGAGCLEAVYCTNKSTDFVLYARNCTTGAASADSPPPADGRADVDRSAAAYSNQFALETADTALPEGGHQMLRATRMSNETSPGGSNSHWIKDGGCVALVKSNLNISLGFASWLFHAADDRPLPAATPVASDPLSVATKFELAAGVEYVLKTSVQSIRPPEASCGLPAVARACSTIATNTTAGLEAAHTAWWERWWNMSAVDLGPNRQVLEGFYYGAHYMLGSFARPGGVTAGLLGPWSVQDPIGWFDDLTLDYNVEANYWGAASANRLEAMEPYFATMDAMVPLCKRRAALPSWSHGGHGSITTWGQQTDMIGCGPESWSVMDRCPSSMGGYDGMECPSSMAAFPDIYTGHDSSVRFSAGLMATPYIDYFEHSMNLSFLETSAYPFIRNVAEFYASYAVPNASAPGKYDLPYTCAQELCTWRQHRNEMHVSHNSLVDIAHATMALRKAAEWSKLLDTDAAARPRWAAVAAGLSDLPVTTDNRSLAHGPAGVPLPGNPARRVWSEAWVGARGSTGPGKPAPFDTNYMYPIVHFAAIHPCGLVGLHNNTLRPGRHDQLIATAVSTVWGDNERSSWRPTNGLCLAWPSATRVTNGSVPGHGAALLDRYENALNGTMGANFWPDLSGGGIEQAGAAVAVDELLLQSHEGFLVLFPAWQRGVSAASFATLRARGAFLVTAAIDAAGRVVPGVGIQSEAGGTCRLVSPWPQPQGVGSASAPPFAVAEVPSGAAVEVEAGAAAGRGVRTYTFATQAGSAYRLNPADR
jgi:hypothetical protein